jgi:O-antigen/teichoic acid export membrane protein
MLRALIPTARALVRLATGGNPREEAEHRDARITRGALASLVARAVSLAVGFITVPLALGHLGPERYGAWITLASVIAWLQIADLGIANGLTNALARANAGSRRDIAQMHVATATWALVLIAGGLTVVALLAWRAVDWATVFNVRSPLASEEMPRAVAVAIGLFLAGLPIVPLERIYAAHQEGALANAWSITASVTSLAAIIFVTMSGGGLVALVAAAMGSHVAVNGASAVWLFGFHKPHLRPEWSAVKWRSAGAVFGQAWRFTIIQSVGIVLFGTDNIIIARVIGPDAVTEYAVASRLFMLVTFVATVYFPYLWPAYADALARGDREWIRRTSRMSVVGTASVALVLGVPLAVVSRPLIHAWAGAPAVPPASLVAWMAAWAVLLSVGSALACVLNGMGHLNGQMIYGMVAAAANIVLSILLARRFGVTGVTAATALTYAVFALGPAFFETSWALRKLQRKEERERAR